LITDDGLSNEWRTQLEKAGVETLFADQGAKS
jgi:DeoR family fructose operon transcriptional repressor